MKIYAAKKILKIYKMVNSLQKADCLFDDILSHIKAEHQLTPALRTWVRDIGEFKNVMRICLRFIVTIIFHACYLTRMKTVPVQDLTDDNRSQPGPVEMVISLCGVCFYLELSWQRDWRDVGVI